MDVEFAFLADAADIHDQKLYVLGGGLSEFTATDFPADIGPLAVVASITLDPSDYAGLPVAAHGNTRSVQMRIVLSNDAGDHIPLGSSPVAAFPGQLDVAGIAESVSFYAVTPIRSITLPQPGVYTVQISLNDDPLTTLSFVVREPAEQA